MRWPQFVPLFAFLVGGIASPVLAFNNGAPTLECFHCHAEAGQTQTVLQLDGLPTLYKPGAIYPLRILLQSTLASLGPVQGGFAVTASAGELLVTDRTHTQLSDSILTHTQEGSALRAWKLSWRAPKEKQAVEISVMATAANGDYSPVGDVTAAEIFTITPKK